MLRHHIEVCSSDRYVRKRWRANHRSGRFPSGKTRRSLFATLPGFATDHHRTNRTASKALSNPL